MTDRKPGGFSRREAIALTAAATASATLTTPARAQPASAPTGGGYTASGPGVPVLTAVVQTKSGSVQGLVRDGIHSFLGVRYGAPPIGALRFMPPKAPEPWTTVYDAADFGAPAMQLAAGTTAYHTTNFGMQMHQVFTTPSEMKVMNEDCLFLNVWTPATDAKKRPVMVWFHGGGFSFGSGAQPIYQGDGLARFGDVVVVSVNHRLNVFGYLHLGDTMGADYASSGTVGMQDLVLSLEWIRDNIQNFGGDPGNVTIMGQSGGGAKVSILLSMPKAKGLFHKASIQSGAGLAVVRKEQSNEATKALLDALKIKPGDIAALQAVPARTLLETAGRLGIGMPGPRGGGSPILDGIAITRDPFTPDAPDESRDIPVMVGWTKDEWTIFTASELWFGKMTEDELTKRVAPLGDAGKALLAAFRKAYPGYSPTYLWEQMISARVMQGTTILAERKAAKGAAPVYVWFLTWETPTLNGAYKSPHTMEIPFMLYSFDKVRTFVGPGKAPKQMADQMAAAWVAFARTGNPNHKGIPNWPAYNTTERPVLDFNLKSRTVNDPLSEARQILEKIPPAMLWRL
jgi:para-nitrobenzyl esterase